MNTRHNSERVPSPRRAELWVRYQNAHVLLGANPDKQTAKRLRAELLKVEREIVALDVAS